VLGGNNFSFLKKREEKKGGKDRSPGAKSIVLKGSYTKEKTKQGSQKQKGRKRDEVHT